MFFLNQMPNDYIVQIFKVMNIKEAIRFSSTSKRYYSILNNPAYGLWKYYLNRDFPNAAWPIDESRFKAAYILEKLAKISDVIGFNLRKKTNPFTNNHPLLSLQCKIHMATLNISIQDLSLLYRAASNAIIAPILVNSTLRQPLELAVFNKRIDIAMTLLSSGCSVVYYPTEPTPTLTKAASCGFTSVVLAMIKAGADVNACGLVANFALHSAAHNGHNEIVNALIKAGADLNVRSYTLSTPLIEASSRGHLECSRSLINAGADIFARSGSLRNAFDHAAHNGHHDIVKILTDEMSQKNRFNTVKPLMLSKANEWMNRSTASSSSTVTSNKRKYGFN